MESRDSVPFDMQYPKKQINRSGQKERKRHQQLNLNQPRTSIFNEERLNEEYQNMIETEKLNKSAKKKAEKAQQRRQNNTTFEIYPNV